jgi:hypothetical protein
LNVRDFKKARYGAKVKPNVSAGKNEASATRPLAPIAQSSLQARPTKAQYVFLDLLERILRILKRESADERLLEFLLKDGLCMNGRWHAFINELERRRWLKSATTSDGQRSWQMVHLPFMKFEELPGSSTPMITSLQFDEIVRRWHGLPPRPSEPVDFNPEIDSPDDRYKD